MEIGNACLIWREIIKTDTTKKNYINARRIYSRRKRHNYHPRAHKYINENEKRLSKETQKYRPLAWIGR